MLNPAPFATFAFVMSITPGPNNLMLTASGAAFGFRRTLPHMLGISLGCALQLLMVCVGLGALFSRWPQLQTLLRWAGAAYLLYLGWRLLSAGAGAPGQSSRALRVREAAAFQFLNPKAWVMTLTAATLFLPRELGLPLAIGYVVGVMVAVNLPCIASWALFGSSLHRLLAHPPSRLGFNLAMGVALGLTGVRMVM